MTKITATQISELYGEFNEKGKKKLKLSEIGDYKKLQQADIQNMSDQELMDLFLRYSEISDKDINEYIKKDISDLFNDKNQVAALRNMLEQNKGDIEYIINGYKKLGKIKKIEKEIENLEKEINKEKLKLYCKNKTLGQAHPTIISKVQELNKKIEQKEKEKEKLLQTKEVVAAYELQKISGYADKLNKGELVYTPSVEKNKEKIRDKIFKGKKILLSGPVGTGKTRLAIDIYEEILEEKRKNREIDDDAYQKLSQLCVVNGNEDTSIRELKSKPIQMSNEEGEENAFTYDEGLLTLCLKYGMPLIIDEANRTSPNFLSSLKKFRAFKKGQKYKDDMTGEFFEIKSPLQVILTANEGQKYSKYTIKLPDQITRELERVYVGYMPENELYDLAKAKLYETPGIANVTETDLQETLPHLINAVTEVNELYTSGKEYSAAGSTSDMKLSSTVFDTKRFLELIDREIIGSKETFWDELNQKIVEFIQGIEPSDAGDMDRKILCTIFHKNSLLCKENIPDLVIGADKLTAHDLSTIVCSTKSQLNIPRGNRFVNPWQFAKGYGKLINREGDFDRHRLANFENLDFEDKGTKLKNIAKSLRRLNILNPMDDGELISELNQLSENNIQRVLSDIVDKVITKDSSKLSELSKILDEADEVIPGIKGQIEGTINSKYDLGDDLSNQEQEGEDQFEELESGEIPQELKDFRQKWEQKIDLDEDTKTAIIKAVNQIPHRATIEKDGSRLVEFELGGKRYKCLDVNVEKHSDSKYLSPYPYNRQTNNEVILLGMRGDDISKNNNSQRKNETLREYVEKEKNNRKMEIPTIEFQRDLIDKLGAKASLTEIRDKIAMWMYLTGNYGMYRLSMGYKNNSNSQAVSRSRLKCDDNLREFDYRLYDGYGASLCLIACE